MDRKRRVMSLYDERDLPLGESVSAVDYIDVAALARDWLSFGWAVAGRCLKAGFDSSRRFRRIFGGFDFEWIIEHDDEFREPFQAWRTHFVRGQGHEAIGELAMAASLSQAAGVQVTTIPERQSTKDLLGLTRATSG